jgi:hypothetical protein
MVSVEIKFVVAGKEMSLGSFVEAIITEVRSSTPGPWFPHHFKDASSTSPTNGVQHFARGGASTLLSEHNLRDSSGQFERDITL